MREEGFTLVEVLIAVTILVAAVSTLAGLVVASARANGNARQTTMAAVLAQQKMSQLRALVWGFDAAGEPVSDSGLGISPEGSLDEDAEGFCDYVDAGSGAFVRRWAVAPLPEHPTNVLVLQVLVASLPEGGPVPAARWTRRPGTARLTSVRTRKAR